KPKPNKRMQELRSQKRDLKKQLSKMRTEVDSNSCAYGLLTKKWRELMHEHARHAKATKLRAESRFNSSQQRKFKADPRKFSKTLFEKKNCGEPDFPEQKAFDYFSVLYRDEARGDSVNAMPDMKSPAAPKH